MRYTMVGLVAVMILASFFGEMSANEQHIQHELQELNQWHENLEEMNHEKPEFELMHEKPELGFFHDHFNHNETAENIIRRNKTQIIHNIMDKQVEKVADTVRLLVQTIGDKLVGFVKLFHAVEDKVDMD